MAFELKLSNPLGVVKGATDLVAKAAMESAQELMRQVNSLLELLQSAGYGIGSLDLELSIPPRATIKLKTGPAVKEEKLSEIVRDHGDEKVVAGVVAMLIQANRLRSSVTVETLVMDGVEIVLTTSPNITLQWKDRQAAA